MLPPHYEATSLEIVLQDLYVDLGLGGPEAALARGELVSWEAYWRVGSLKLVMEERKRTLDLMRTII